MLLFVDDNLWLAVFSFIAAIWNAQESGGLFMQINDIDPGLFCYCVIWLSGNTRGSITVDLTARAGFGPRYRKFALEMLRVNDSLIV